MSPRPSSSLRLADLDPAEVAEECHRLVLDHVSTLLLSLDPNASWRVEGSVLRPTVQLLTAYAQTGDVEGGGPKHAVDGIQQVCEALYAQAGKPGTFDLGALDDLHPGVPDDAIGLVLVGAYARAKLASPASEVTPRELAVLAGVTDHQIRHLGRAGELAIQDGVVTRKEARRFLGARGVAGF